MDRTVQDPAAVVERLLKAVNDHDLEAMAAPKTPLRMGRRLIDEVLGGITTGSKP